MVLGYFWDSTHIYYFKLIKLDQESQLRQTLYKYCKRNIVPDIKNLLVASEVFNFPIMQELCKLLKILSFWPNRIHLDHSGTILSKQDTFGSTVTYLDKSATIWTNPGPLIKIRTNLVHQWSTGAYLDPFGPIITNWDPFGPKRDQFHYWTRVKNLMPHLPWLKSSQLLHSTAMKGQEEVMLSVKYLAVSRRISIKDLFWIMNLILIILKIP